MPDVTSTLQSILADHGVATTNESDGWLSTNGKYPACRAYTGDPQWRDGGCKLGLDVEIALFPDRVINESFSDFATDANSAFRASLRNFCTGSLHVLLSGLWRQCDPDQVLVEQWKIGDQRWTLHIGNLVRKSHGGADILPAEDLMEIFDGCIMNGTFDSQIHWGRLFYANMPNRDNIVEVLLDNQPWLKAREQIGAASWPRLDLFYSTRMFWLMVPA
jgi:hypothetical protein